MTREGSWEEEGGGKGERNGVQAATTYFPFFPTRSTRISPLSLSVNVECVSEPRQLARAQFSPDMEKISHI